MKIVKIILEYENESESDPIEYPEGKRIEIANSGFTHTGNLYPGDIRLAALLIDIIQKRVQYFSGIKR